jgi:hypothetical protein
MLVAACAGPQPHGTLRAASAPPANSDAFHAPVVSATVPGDAAAVASAASPRAPGKKERAAVTLSQPALPAATRPVTCTRTGPVVREVGKTPPELDELSGLTASLRHPGLFWAHNDDSVKGFTLYALDAEGRVRASFPLYVSVTDVEDVAVGPCPEGTCLWLADIGDNGRRRPQVQLLRIVEPASLASRPLPVEVLRFAYEDGSQDAESLVVEPRTGRLFVLTKPLDALARVYRVEGAGPVKPGRAVRVATLPAAGLSRRAATAASLSRDGSRLLVRSYLGAWEWARPGAERLEDVLTARPREVPARTQSQGEAVAWLPDDSGYLLGSEGAGAPLYRVDCVTPPTP